jgi:predicted small lipoprotein YifL
MKKRVVSVFMALAMGLSIVACGVTAPETPVAEPAAEQKEETAAEQTKAPEAVTPCRCYHTCYGRGKPS